MTDHDPPQDNDDDFDDELELEPVDPEVLEHERRRAMHKVRAAEDSVDINESYDSADAEDPFDFGELKKFRFSTKHLLIVTALLSVVMTVAKLTSGFTAVFFAFAATVAGGWWFVIRRERQQAAEMERRRREMKAQIAARRAAEDGTPIEAVEQPASVRIPIDAPQSEPAFDFSFSLKEMFGAFTAAAVIMGLVRGMGGPQNAAVLLGTIALLGLVLHAVGFDPPRVIILGWWLLLVLYLIVSLWAVFGSEQALVPRFVEDYRLAYCFSSVDSEALTWKTLGRYVANKVSGTEIKDAAFSFSDPIPRLVSNPTRNDGSEHGRSSTAMLLQLH